MMKQAGNEATPYITGGAAMTRYGWLAAWGWLWLAAPLSMPLWAGGPEGSVLAGGGDPCERGTVFNALKVVRAYRDNQAFAFRHMEGKELEISGRLLAVRRDKIIVGDTVVFEGFVALVTPDGKPPKPFGLEFRFPLATLQADSDLACQVGQLWPGKYVTLRGTCQGALPGGEDYVGIIFNDAQIVH